MLVLHSQYTGQYELQVLDVFPYECVQNIHLKQKQLEKSEKLHKQKKFFFLNYIQITDYFIMDAANFKK